MSVYITFISLLLLFAQTSSFMTRQEYNDMIKNAEFETLDYETFLDIFSNKNIRELTAHGEEIVKQHNYERQKYFSREEYKLLNFLYEDNLPSSYDCRAKYPTCFQNNIRDQKYCGSCWSFATSAAFGERLCIKNKGASNTLYSQQYMISCSKKNNACSGGTLYHAWQFLINEGTATEYCLPYTSGNGDVQSCPRSCKYDDLPLTLTKAQGKPRFFEENDFEAIKREIYTNGPVTSGMQTYKDLNSYKGGIYVPSTKEKSEMHAVTIVGWGNDFTKGDYWIVQNSWGSTWGESGYFKIPVKSCQISIMVVVGDV